jgi:hypothetical protein
VGIPPEVPRDVRVPSDYFRRQGRHADELAAELDSPARRRRYIAQFYGSRFWAAPGTFAPADVEFMTEPFADPDTLRAGFGIYETALGTAAAEPPRLFERSAVPTSRCTGPRTTCCSDFPAAARSPSLERIGPLWSSRARATSCSGSGRTC